MISFTCLNIPPVQNIHYMNVTAHLPFTSKPHRTTQSSRIRFAVNPNNNNNNNIKKEAKEKQQQNGSSNGNGDELKKEGRPMFSFKWGDIFDPDPDNILAVGLTGLLAWASVQLLWQLTFISLAILVAALKYSFIAALLIFILITLL